MDDKEALEEIKRDQAELQKREMQLMEKQASLRNTAMSSTEGRQRIILERGNICNPYHKSHHRSYKINPEHSFRRLVRQRLK